MKVDNLYAPGWSFVTRVTFVLLTVSASRVHLDSTYTACIAGAEKDSVLPALTFPPLSLGNATDSIVAAVNMYSAPPGDAPPVSTPMQAPALHLPSFFSTRAHNRSSASSGPPHPPVACFGGQPLHQIGARQRYRTHLPHFGFGFRTFEPSHNDVFPAVSLAPAWTWTLGGIIEPRGDVSAPRCVPGPTFFQAGHRFFAVWCRAVYILPRRTSLPRAPLSLAFRWRDTVPDVVPTPKKLDFDQ